MNTEELKAKRANRDRIKDFSANLHHYNKKVIEHTRLVNISNDCADGEKALQTRPTHSNSATGARGVLQVESSRERALEFARNVPKPRVVRRPSERDVVDVPATNVGMLSMGNNEESQRQMRLLELESKHSSDRQRVTGIKKSLGLL